MQKRGLLLLLIAATAQTEPPSEKMVMDDPRGLIAQGQATLAAPPALPTSPRPVELLALMGRAAVQLGDDAALAEVLLRLQADSDPQAAGVAHLLRSERQRARGLHEEQLTEALAGAATLEDAAPSLDLQSQFVLCAAYIDNRRLDDAERHCDRAAEIARGLDDFHLARVENTQSFIPYLRGDIAKAMEISERALRRARDIGAEGMWSVIAGNLAQGYVDVGRLDEALALSREALERALAAGRINHAVEARVNIARVLHATGHSEEGLRELATALEEVERVGYGRVLEEVYTAQGQIAEQSGRMDVALRAARALADIRLRPGDRPSPDVVAELETRYQAREQSLRIRALEQERRADQLRLAEVGLESERQRGWLVALAIAVVAGVGVLAALAWALRMQRRLSLQLQDLSERDPLTGVENRRAFMQRLDHLFAASSPHERSALMILDLDHFKTINDEYGHPFGDTVLLATVAAVKGALEDGCRFARLGGEEFAVLYDRHDAEAAVALAERLRVAVAGMRVSGPRGEVRLSVSIGVAPWRAQIEQPGAWLRAADSALYRAKGEGRNRVVTVA